jgi:hypothetical protein
MLDQSSYTRADKAERTQLEHRAMSSFAATHEASLAQTVLSLLSSLERALQTSPDGLRHHQVWMKYVRYQQLWPHILDAVAEWLHEDSDEDCHGPRFQLFQLIYAPDPYPVNVEPEIDDELVALGLLTPWDDRAPNTETWTTPLGREVLAYFEEQSDA